MSFSKIDVEKWIKKIWLFTVIIVLISINISHSSPLWLDIFIIFTFILALLVLFISIFAKNIMNISTYPIILWFVTYFDFVINGFLIAGFILIKGLDFNDRLITLVSSLFKSLEYTGLIVSFVIFTAILVFHYFFVIKGFARFSDIISRRKSLNQESDFLNTIEAVNAFISKNVKLKIFLLLIVLSAGIIIGIFLKDESFSYLVSMYVPLVIGAGIYFMITPLLLSIAVRCIAKRFENDIQNG